MSHEARINDALKQLGEEYRLGMVQPVEYRQRRRALIESWGERDVTTSPGSLRAMGLATGQTGQHKAAARDKAMTSKLLAVGVAGLVVIGAGAWFALGNKAPEPVAETAALPPAPPPASANVVAMRKAAEDFLAGNAWEKGPVDALLAKWRVLTPEERVRAREEPVVRTLRFKLDQNIQAESQLVTADSPPEDRQRLDLLTQLAQELDASS